VSKTRSLHPDNCPALVDAARSYLIEVAELPIRRPRRRKSSSDR